MVTDIVKQSSGVLLTIPRYVIDGFGAMIFEGLCRRLHFGKDALLAQSARSYLFQ